MDLAHLADEELMVMYQNGNEKAFQVLYDRHSGRIFSYLRSKVSNADLADDIFQEVFIKIHRSKHLYNSSFQVLPWIFTVTRNTMIDCLRKKKNMLESVGEVDFEQMPASALEESVGISDLAPVMAQLPEMQRQALQLRYVNEKTFEEIAEQLETSSQNVRQLVSRGVKNLKKMFQSGEQDGSEEQ